MRLVVVAATAALLGACTTGCAEDELRLPTELIDGSPVRRAPVELEGVDGPAVLTRVRLRPSLDVPAGSAAAACTRERLGGEAASTPIVERDGVHSESVTLAVASGRGLVACDNTQGPREGGARWCGGAFGSLVRGRLRDPRLNILCSTADGEPMAFAWALPGPETAFLAVEQPGFTEVYEVTAGLPVRVSTTSDVDVARARAELALSEHDAAGALLRRYALRASVAG